MRVLVGCERTAVVRDAFRRRGHDAWSCDIEPTEGDPTWHIQSDLLAHLAGWDLLIAFPPCQKQSGQRPPTPEVARKYAERFPQLNALVESGLIEEWAEHVKGNGGGGSFPKNFGKWVDQEQNAANLFYWAPILVPGMFQTPGYARAVLSAMPREEPVDDLLADRLGRQQIPYPRVMIQVIPAEIGVHAGVEGAVSIADRDDGRTVVHLESLTDAQTTGELETLVRVREITGMLRSEALSRTASRELMAKVAEEKWKTQN